LRQPDIKQPGRIRGLAPVPPFPDVTQHAAVSIPPFDRGGNGAAPMRHAELVNGGLGQDQSTSLPVHAEGVNSVL
jgi:hypothetical protein